MGCSLHVTQTCASILLASSSAVLSSFSPHCLPPSRHNVQEFCRSFGVVVVIFFPSTPPSVVSSDYGAPLFRPGPSISTIIGAIKPPCHRPYCLVSLPLSNPFSSKHARVGGGGSSADIKLKFEINLMMFAYIPNLYIINLKFFLKVYLSIKE